MPRCPFGGVPLDPPDPRGAKPPRDHAGLDLLPKLPENRWPTEPQEQNPNRNVALVLRSASS
eukprot:15005794-Alexandrium_andersonii.AAC.1